MHVPELWNGAPKSDMREEVSWMAMVNKKSRNTKDAAADWQPGIGHNSNYAPAEELAAELAALQQAEAETEACDAAKPELIEYLYEVRFHPGGSLTTGELEAYDMKHAQRQLRVILGLTRLPVETRIIEKHIVDEEKNKQSAERNRRLLRTLTAHHRWLQGENGGVRADLSGARLRGAKLVGADLTGADLSGANLTGSNLSSASLTEANLIEADLSSANLQAS